MTQSATMERTAVDAGRPARFDVTLRRTLDDPELGWLVWRRLSRRRWSAARPTSGPFVG